MAAIDAVIGLGNPGSRYERTRHNVGFWLVDELARLNGGQFVAERKLHGDVVRVMLDDCEVRLVKPSTFVNRSGQCVQALCAYFRIPLERVLIVHDDLDLPPGTVRLKHGGGHGGHNGLRDTIAHMGADFPRLRIGIGHPGQRDEVVNYVLGVPGKDEAQALDEAVQRAVDVMPLLVRDGLEPAMQRLHTKSGDS